MSRPEGEVNKSIEIVIPDIYGRLYKAAQDYFAGKLSLEDYQDFKNQHRLFPPTILGPYKQNL